MTMLRREFLVAVSTMALTHRVLARGEDSRTPTSKAAALLKQVAVIGASVTRGLSSGVPLAALLDYAIRVEHEKVSEFADFAMALDTLKSGEAQVDRALEIEPTFVVGLDFLFWYAHFVPAGKDTLETRLERFERGLAQLDRIQAPIVCGDVPRIVDVPEKRLPPAAIPSNEVRAAQNAKLREFAAKRPRVQLVPLSTWVEEMREGKWKLPGSENGESKETVLTPETTLHPNDRMHPTTLGALALGDRLIGSIRTHHGLLARELSFDVWKAKKKLAGG